MPTKHILKSYSAPAFYHVYNRASGERLLFKDGQDRQYFIDLLQKHLSELETEDNEVKKYEVEVIAYCLMGTHFHLLLFQEFDDGAITGYMRSVGTAYSMFYNKKYKTKGHVFQSSYRASHVSSQPYLAHITRYIHLNPRRYESWAWSSYKDYVGARKSDWLHPERVLDTESPVAVANYKNDLSDYARVDRRKQSSEIEKHS